MLATKEEKALAGFIEIITGLFSECGRRCAASRDTMRPYALGFCLKLTQHAISTVALFEGSIPKSDGSRALDVHSVSVLARAGWESFLLFRHVFIDVADEDERMMRYLRWSIASPEGRQKYVATRPAQRTQKREELKEINRRRNEIRGNPAFLRLSAKEQKALMEAHDGRTAGWSKIATTAGITKLYATDQYHVLCDYAHTGWFSVSIFRRRPSKRAIQRIKKVTAGMLAIATANAIAGLEVLFPGCTASLDRSDSELLQDWINVGRSAPTIRS